MSDFTVVAWSGIRQRFHNAADDLRKACEEFGHAYHMVQPDLTEHMAKQISPEYTERHWACRYHYPFMLRCLDELDTDILYMHCDWTLQHPITPESWEGLDIGLQDARSHNPPRPDYVLGAPVFARNNEPARRFLRTVEAVLMNVDNGLADHRLMADVYRLMSKRDRTLRIGQFDPPLGSIREDDDTPIVGHK